MSNIKIKNLSFRYENSSEEIFTNLNLDLNSSWKLGLVGRNGKGKTTFLNLLTKKLQGNGQIQTKFDFIYFPLQVRNPKNIILYELQDQINVEQWKLEKELNQMKVDPNLIWQPFETLSGGEKTKILLAVAFTQEDSFPLIDEPTNHLDEDSRKQISEYLKQQKIGYIVVSHDREFLNEVTDHILALENNQIHLYQGNYASYEANKEKRDNFNINKNEKLKSEIKELNRSRQKIQTFSKKSENKKNARAHLKTELNSNLDKGFLGHKAAKIMKRSKNVERRIEKDIAAKQGLLTNIEEADDLSMNFIPNYHQQVLKVQNLNIRIGEKQLFKDLSFKVNNHEIVVLKGKNGSGKSTLLKFILGKEYDLNINGKVELTSNLKISYLSQEFIQYQGSLKDFVSKYHLSYTELLNLLRKVGFARDSFTTKIEDMSLGQQKRVALVKSLLEPADFYLWDEPVNYLDVFNQDQLIKLLKTVRPTMLLIDHDDYFIKQVATKIINL